jgi:hypothetical protein
MFHSLTRTYLNRHHSHEKAGDRAPETIDKVQETTNRASFVYLISGNKKFLSWASDSA